MPEILIGQITSVPNKMISDTTNNKITINIQNLGDKDAELVKSKLRNPWNKHNSILLLLTRRLNLINFSRFARNTNIHNRH